MGSSLSSRAEGDCRFLVLLLRAKGLFQVENLAQCNELAAPLSILYYNCSSLSFQGAYLLQLHAEEVLDLQEVAGKFRVEYGEKARDATHCKECDLMHKSVR